MQPRKAPSRETVPNISFSIVHAVPSAILPTVNEAEYNGAAKLKRRSLRARNCEQKHRIASQRYRLRCIQVFKLQRRLPRSPSALRAHNFTQLNQFHPPLSWEQSPPACVHGFRLQGCATPDAYRLVSAVAWVLGFGRESHSWVQCLGAQETLDRERVVRWWGALDCAWV